MAAVARALPGTLQMINGDGNFSSQTASFTSELNNYTVVSIIGSQSSGKSYLLNSLFGTGFDVLNAVGGRKKTTKGIWIAKCINPGMVIMDVEGSDGEENGQHKLFERRSALFSLAVSDVLLLNMFYTSIGLDNSANIPLIETIFKEMVNIQATKTKIIVVVRDHRYGADETPVDVTTEQIHDMMNEIWQNVHPGNKEMMSDYVEVTVKDFPHKSQEHEFASKCEDLSNLLRFFAANENPEEANYVSDFAKSSELIWDRIRDNKELIAADHMVTKSKYYCKKAIKSLLRSLDEGKTGDWMNDLTISPKDFVAGLPSVQNNILIRYEEQTASLLITVRDKKKAKLEEELKERFRKGFCERVDHLANGLLELARENLKPALEKLKTPDNDAIIEVMKPYIIEFHDNIPSAEDLKCREDLLRELRKKLENFLTELKGFAEENAFKIKIEEERNEERQEHSSSSLIPIIKSNLIKVAVRITIGTVWAACTGDSSLLIDSVQECLSSVAQ